MMILSEPTCQMAKGQSGPQLGLVQMLLTHLRQINKLLILTCRLLRFMVALVDSVNDQRHWNHTAAIGSYRRISSGHCEGTDFPCLKDDDQIHLTTLCMRLFWHKLSDITSDSRLEWSCAHSPPCEIHSVYRHAIVVKQFYDVLWASKLLVALVLCAQMEAPFVCISIVRVFFYFNAYLEFKWGFYCY